MSNNKRTSFKYLGTTLLALPLAMSLAFAPVVSAQPYTPERGQQAPQATFSQQELDQMLAPIALYPDSLLSQILMAATYPLEVVQAARWSRANPGLQGDHAVRSIERQDWDPSVKSLVAFPQILEMMDAKLEWTERLGDAFLAQEPQVMDTVQNLRQRAHAAGNLQSDDQIRVMAEGPAIVVEPADPQFVYVPYYDPLVVYGSWWWPAPPVYWTPWRGYHAPRPGYYFSWGVGVPVASGFFFGAFDWQRRHARVVNVNTYYYNRTLVVSQQTESHNRTIVHNVNTVPGAWQHDPARRGGAQYRGTAVRARPAAEGAQANFRYDRPATPPQARVAEDRNNAVREPRPPIEHQQLQAARRADVRPDARTESRPEARAERQHQAAFRRDETPPAVRAQPPAAQPRPEIVARPAPAPAMLPRVEMPRPPAPPPQPRVEAPRQAAMQPQAAPAQPAQNAPESRSHGGNGGPRQGGGESRGGGR